MRTSDARDVLRVPAARLARRGAAGPAQPVAIRRAQGERVVMDAVFWAVPGDETQTCLQLPPGHLGITLRLEDVGTPQPSATASRPTGTAPPTRRRRSTPA